MLGEGRARGQNEPEAQGRPEMSHACFPSAQVPIQRRFGHAGACHGGKVNVAKPIGGDQG
jgi:hypothetical protein